MSGSDPGNPTEGEEEKKGEIPGDREDNETGGEDNEHGEGGSEHDEGEEDEEEEEEEEGKGRILRKIIRGRSKLIDVESEEEEGSEEEDIYQEKDLEDAIAAAKRMSLETADEDEEEFVEYGDEEEEGYISGPFLSIDSTVPENVLEFHHSFGYDCRRHYNLCIPDPHTVIFASGNYINFFDIKTKELIFRRTARGCGIGHIIKNPNPKYPHIAVAEKGPNPLILIYLWPSMEVIHVLRGGTKRAFACLHYSPDGRFLCSQGCEPDHFLTVWNWKKGRILRQQRAYGQDVFNAMFSDYSLGNLTTSGYGHIKFWKLAKTFTGLKLMGSIGRFGKTEMCDIIGFIALPDEQVISGCEWGNMLIWNEGLVKAEVCRKGETPCHEGYISQLLYDHVNKEVITIGTDGFIKAWDFNLIENADLFGDSPKIKIESLYSLEVGKGVNKSSMLYIEKQELDPENSFWFAQDGNGGIWLLDLDQDHPVAPEKIFYCHAGGVRSVAACPYDTYMASYGDDGRLFFYNYATKSRVLVHKFAAGGGFMVWPDTKVDATGDVVICGGADGLIRVVVVALQKREAAGQSARDEDFICLIQTTKPHTRRITYMSIWAARSLLVTGSEDATIFIYQILQRHDYVSLNPIGFVNLPSAVTHITWKPNVEAPTVLVSCFGGQAVLMEIPDVPQVYTKESYELITVESNIITFHSVKAQIRRDILLEEDAQRRQEKLEMKKEKLKEMREENPNLKIDEELYFEDSESSLTLESLYFPEVPNPILFSRFMSDDIVWLSPAGYDAGYMYEYMVDYEDPIKCTMVADADDIEIHSYILDPTREFLILGMQNGKIRVCRIQEDISDLSNYWELSMHDNDNGIIPQMCFSYDNKYFFSCGHDGNVFAYAVASEADTPSVRKHKTSAPWPSDSLEDIADPEMYSLEQLKQKADYDARMKLANDHKQSVLASLRKLKDRFISVVKLNKSLPMKLRIPYGEFKIDHRIEDDLEDELEDKLALEKRKLAHQAEKSELGLKKLQDYYYNVLDSPLVTIYAIKNKNLRAYSFRAKILSPDFWQAKQFVEDRLDETERRHRPAASRTTKTHTSITTAKRLQLATWLKGMGTVGPNIKMNVKLQRLLLKYYERKRLKELREEQWSQMMKIKPDPNVSHPDDVAAIEYAEKTIGDFKMKTDPNYTARKEERITMDKKYLQLLTTRRMIHEMQMEFNDKLFRLRDKKVKLIEHITELNKKLIKIHKELPAKDREMPPPIPEILNEVEFPENACTLKEEDIRACYSSPRSLPSRRQQQDEEAAAEEWLEYMTKEEEADEEFFRSPEELRPARRRLSVSAEHLDPGYEILLRDAAAPPPLKTRGSLSGLRRGRPPSKYSPDQFLSDIDIRKFIFKSRDDHKDTPWEREMRYRRLGRSRYMQNSILKEIDQQIDEFDKEVIELKDARFQVDVDIKYGELHLIKLHQELIILKEFESVEDRLASKVNATEDQLSDVNAEISDMQHQIEIHKEQIESLNIQEKQLGTIFNERIENNNYADFLRKIYKKKYKPPKIKHDDDESSSSSESSEESESSTEEDEGSFDSQDMGIIKLDESICPPDLDREIYDMTFEMRSQRHQLEIREAEEKKRIDALRREIEVKVKSIKSIEKTLASQKAELLAYQREKQHRLNEVMCVVALKASQMQYFADSNADLTHIGDKLVFSNKTLLRLQARVGELNKETQMQRNKLRSYKQHHRRMQIDCRHMQKEIKELKKKIELTLIQRFGSVVDVDELEEIVLQRLIVQLRTTEQELRNEFLRLARALKEERRKQEKILNELFRNNDQKMNVLTILITERTNLSKLMPEEAEKNIVTMKEILSYSEELKKLKRVIRNQASQIEVLQEETKNLRYKGKPLLPICTPRKLEEELKKIKLLIAEKDKLPEVEDEEEDDENLFLYMESTEAVQLVKDRVDLEERTKVPSVRQIVDDLVRGMSKPDEEALSQVLDRKIEKLIRRIPETDVAFGIINEVTELLSTRLSIGDDPQQLRKILVDILHDMRSTSHEPSEIATVLEYAFNRVKAREKEVQAAMSARAITYDILRKCMGFFLGKQFFLSTEEAMLQVLGTVEDESDGQALVEEVMVQLGVKMEEVREQVDVYNFLDLVMHDLRSLQSHKPPHELFGTVFHRFQSHEGSHKDIAVARNIFHDILKKAIGVAAETAYPVSELGTLEPDRAVFLMLGKLPAQTDMTELLDEIEMLLEIREVDVDQPETRLLTQTFTQDITARPTMKTEDVIPFFEGILKKLATFGASDKHLLQAHAIMWDVVKRAITYIFPDIHMKEVVQYIEPTVVILSLLDAISSDKDTTKLYDDIIEELTEKSKTELFPEVVQALLPEIIQNFAEVKGKASGVKNAFADFIADIKDKKLFQSDTLCIMKLLEDATRYSITIDYPEMVLEEDEDVKKTEKYILNFFKYVDSENSMPLLRELSDTLDAWETKPSDPPEIEQVLKEIVQKLRALIDESARPNKCISYVFKMIYKKGSTKEVVLRLLYIMKFCVKAAIRAVAPSVTLEDEESHFNPDETTLAMLRKVSGSPYVALLCSKIQEELRTVLTKENITEGTKNIFIFILRTLSQLTDDIPNLYQTVENALGQLKDLDVSKMDSIYARIYINDIVRMLIGTVFPRTDIREASCSMDKERSTLLMLQKIPLTDDVFVLYDEVREEMETRYETIEDSPEVQKAIHDAIVELFVEPSDIDNTLHIFNEIYMSLRLQNISRLAMLTAKTIFYEAVKKCIENVFPYVDTDDAIVIDKELPIMQLLDQAPSRREYKELIEEIIKELHPKEEAVEGILKDMLSSFIKDFSGKSLDIGNLFLVRPCFLRIKSWGAPVKYFKSFQEILYSAIKKSIQKIYPDVDLQDNQSAWENEEEILAIALRLPRTDDTTVIIEEIREHLDVAKNSVDLTEGLQKILREIEHHLTVMPIEVGGFEHHIHCIFTILRSRKGDRKDIAQVKSMIYKAIRDSMDIIRDTSLETNVDAESIKSHSD